MDFLRQGFRKLSYLHTRVGLHTDRQTYRQRQFFLPSKLLQAALQIIILLSFFHA